MYADRETTEVALDGMRRTIAALKDAFNALLAAIRNAGLMESAPPN